MKRDQTRVIWCNQQRSATDVLVQTPGGLQLMPRQSPVVSTDESRAVASELRDLREYIRVLEADLAAGRGAGVLSSYRAQHAARKASNTTSNTQMPVKSLRELFGAPPSTASTKDSVLLIIDAQNEYASGSLAVSNLASSRPAIAALLQRYRAASDPSAIMHIVHIVPLGTGVFTPGTALADEFVELKPLEGERVVEKRFPGLFAETELGELVKGTGRGKLVLVGYMAHDAVGDRDIPGASGADVTKMVLLELDDAFATIVKSSDIN
ncbi:Isochorismatase-like protein [Mycena epipterygia]|nr:Isochorismatase-like protein [Mycena epipterygia]